MRKRICLRYFLKLDIIDVKGSRIYGFPFINLFRLVRILLAKIQYSEKTKWDQKKKSQQSAFFIKPKCRLNWTALFLNKYTFYPLCVFTLLFNNQDLSEGYIVSAINLNSR